MYTSVFHPEELLGKINLVPRKRALGLLYEISNTRLCSKGSLIQGPSRPFLDQADEPPNKGETLAVHGCHCLGDMALRMREVLTRRWVCGPCFKF